MEQILRDLHQLSSCEINNNGKHAVYYNQTKRCHSAAMITSNAKLAQTEGEDKHHGKCTANLQKIYSQILQADVVLAVDLTDVADENIGITDNGGQNGTAEAEDINEGYHNNRLNDGTDSLTA